MTHSFYMCYLFFTRFIRKVVHIRHNTKKPVIVNLFTTIFFLLNRREVLLAFRLLFIFTLRWSSSVRWYSLMVHPKEHVACNFTFFATFLLDTIANSEPYKNGYDRMTHGMISLMNTLLGNNGNYKRGLMSVTNMLSYFSFILF